MTIPLPLPLALLDTFTSHSFLCVCVCVCVLCVVCVCVCVVCVCVWCVSAFSLLLHELPSKHTVFFLFALSFPHVLHIHLHAPSLPPTFIFVLLTGFLSFFFEEGVPKWLPCTFHMYALRHPRTHTLHRDRTVFATFVLSNFILILPYTHSLLSPCFSFLLSFLEPVPFVRIPV